MEKKTGKKLLLISALVIGLSITACEYSSGATESDDADDRAVAITPMYGVTIETLTNSNVSKLVTALQSMSVKPTVRIVFQKENAASFYKANVAKIHNVAYVLGCVYDSEGENGTTLAAHHTRWVQYVTTLGSTVDIWEVGNEVNGEGWLGDDSSLLSKKFYDAYKYCKGLNLKTYLTPYMFRPGDQSGDRATMLGWLNKYIPSDMKAGLDYVMVSYYDDDNGGKHDPWQSTFDGLQKMFPNSAIGFGECGFADPHSAGSAFDKRVDAYYKMKKYTTHYVGGYFWWYWGEDCKNVSDSRWKKINDDCVWMKQNLK